MRMNSTAEARAVAGAVSEAEAEAEANVYDDVLKTLMPHVNILYLNILLVCGLLSWCVIQRITYYKNLPPGPWGVPYFGYLPFMNSVPHKWYLEKSNQYGDIFSVKMGCNLIVCIGSAKLLKELFYRQDSIGRPHTPLISLLGGLGIVQSEGILWKKQRQFLYNKFRALGVKLCSNARFEKFVLMEVAGLFEKLEILKEEAVDPSLVFGRHMHNVILQLMMSYRFQENDQQFQTFNDMINRGMKLYGSVHFGEHVKQYLKLPGKKAIVEEIKANLKDVSKFHVEHVKNRMKLRQAVAGRDEPADLLDYYLDEIEEENQNNKTNTIFPNVQPENQIVQVMNDLFSAGMETSRTTIIWCLVMMLREPHVAFKVRQCLKQVVHIGELVSLEHRPQLAYIEAVIYETLRMVSVVPLGTTHVNTRCWNVHGYNIPRGCHIVPLINKMNHDPNTYPNPEQFKPERFLKNDQLSIPEHFTPFGIGQRMCLGTQLARMELFLFLSNLMNSYEFYLGDEQDMPGLDGVLGTTHAPSPFQLCFKKRSTE